MITVLHGWCVDREPQVLVSMLRESGLSDVKGKFTSNGFESEVDITEEVQTAISSFFAPGGPVIRLSDEQKFELLQEKTSAIATTQIDIQTAIAEMMGM